jgi:homospermidine synthase
MNKKVIILGSGSVGKCVLYYLKSYLKTVQYKNVYIVDKLVEPQHFPAVQKRLQEGAHYIVFNITVSTLNTLFNNLIGARPGDVVIDLTTRTNCYEIFRYTRKHGLHYINTSVEEEFEPEIKKPCHCPLDGTIWLQHSRLYDIERRTKEQSVTSIIEFGMNPGLISVFVKHGILDIARYVLQHHKQLPPKVRAEIKRMIDREDFAGIGKMLKIRTIHCSELDTQVPSKPNPQGRFVNTWSCLGMIDEAFEDAEISLGSHEKDIPIPDACMTDVVDNLVVIHRPSLKVRMYSYVPTCVDKKGQVHFTEITGSAIHHGEMVSLNRYFVSEQFAPTMNYVYCPCPDARKSFEKISKEGLIDRTLREDATHVMTMHEDRLTGYDNVGACFILEANPVTGEQKPWAFWTGTMLDTEYTTKKLGDKCFGPTTIQVMAGILSATDYMIKHPQKGMLFSEDIPIHFILTRAHKHLGRLFSGPVTGCNIRGCDLKHLLVK